MTAILFDLDGTLIDSAPDIHAAVARMLDDEGITPLTLETVRSFIGNGVPVLIDRLMARLGEPADARRRADLIARFMGRYEAASANLTVLYPGVEKALAALDMAAHPMGLCTNKPEVTTRNILKAFGIDPYFKVVIGGDSLPQRKPHPAPLLAARHALECPRALYVGDSEIDAQAAAAADIPLVLFTQGYRKTPVVELHHSAAFGDFTELPDIITMLEGD